MKKYIAFAALLCLITCSVGFGADIALENSTTAADDPFYDPFDDNGETTSSTPRPKMIPDPLEGYNRAMFAFNDNFYFYSLKPMAEVYVSVVPEPARWGVKRFFLNLITPTRFLNCLLQGKFKGAGVELSRFLINTTMGIAGFFDPAKETFGLKCYGEDFGQTLGSYGMGTGIYIVWPFLGPSSVRGTIGLALGTALDPFVYAKIKLWESIVLKGYKMTNDASLIIGEYEDLKKAAIDPYISLRNAYFQHRESIVKK